MVNVVRVIKVEMMMMLVDAGAGAGAGAGACDGAGEWWVMIMEVCGGRSWWWSW